MTNPLREAAPRLHVLSTIETQAPALQWFAIRYVQSADPTLPRTLCATAAAFEAHDGKPVVRFYVSPPNAETYCVLEIPSDHVERLTHHNDLADALAAGSGADDRTTV